MIMAMVVSTSIQTVWNKQSVKKTKNKGIGVTKENTLQNTFKSFGKNLTQDKF